MHQQKPLHLSLVARLLDHCIITKLELWLSTYNFAMKLLATKANTSNYSVYVLCFFVTKVMSSKFILSVLKWEDKTEQAFVCHWDIFQTSCRRNIQILHDFVSKNSKEMYLKPNSGGTFQIINYLTNNRNKLCLKLTFFPYSKST